MELVTPENPYAAKLTLPTRSDGATISKNGWEIGGDTITRTTTKGRVEGEPYKDIISKLIIHEDHIEIGLLLKTSRLAFREVFKGKANGPKRTLHIPLTDITEIRKQADTNQIEYGNNLNPQTFVFETAEDVYKIALYSYDKESDFIKTVLSDSMPNLEEPIEKAVEKVRKNMEEPVYSKKKSTTQNNSIADDLERIKELHDKGVLTDEEFSKAKNRLLED